MLFATMERAIALARPCDLEGVARDLWRLLGEGRLTEAEAEALGRSIEARTAPAAASRSAAPRPPAQGSRPATPESLARRRRWAASGWLPPQIAARFTLAEQAVLAVVAWECARRGDCRLPVGQIAALAGVGRSSVKRAIRAARAPGLDLVRVEERRLSRWRSETNVVRIQARDWTGWLRMRAERARPGQGGGVQRESATNTRVNSGGRRSGGSGVVLCERERRPCRASGDSRGAG